MTARTPQIALAPERCDQCGACVRACPQRALRVGGGLIYIDTEKCDGCLECVAVCGRGAITRCVSPRQRAGVPRDGARAVVGSRAEVKALRQAEIEAERARSKAAVVSARQDASRAVSERLARQDAEEGRVPWTLPEAGVVLAVMMASLFASDALFGMKVVSLMPLPGQAVTRSVVLALFYGVQVATLTALARRHGTDVRAAFGLTGLRRGARSVAVSVGIVVALLVVTRLASTLWGLAARSAGWDPPSAGAITAAFGGGGVGFVLAALTVVVLGPVAEEMAFRGVILRAAGDRWGKWPAIVGTAALFAAYHVTAWTVVPLFVLGVALGWLAWVRRSIVSAIALHSLYNGIVVAAAYWLER